MTKKRTRATTTRPENKENTIVIESVRLSFIWAEILPDFLLRKVPAGSPFEPFTRDYKFAEMFAAARGGATKDPKLETPWIHDRQQRFWMRYLVQGKLNEVPGSQAWSYLVPLRLDIGLKPQADWFQGDIFIDAFYYPFGTAVIISFRWEPNVSLDRLVPDAYAIYNGKFSVANGAKDLRLADLADAAFDQLHQRALGSQSQGESRSADPMSIFTIIQGKGVDLKAEVRKNTAVMKALEALTSWPANPDPDAVKLPDLDWACLKTLGHSPDNAALFAERRGRAAWIPSLFTGGQPRTQAKTTAKAAAKSKLASKLSCYHRNLLFASMQTESLGRLVSYTARLFAQGKTKADLTTNHRDVAHNAALQLAKLYRASKDDTWRSESPHRQIEENFFQDLQNVLKEYDEASLPDPASTNPPATKGDKAAAPGK
jgi:hypothetical protein